MKQAFIYRHQLSLVMLASEFDDSHEAVFAHMLGVSIDTIKKWLDENSLPITAYHRLVTNLGETANAWSVDPPSHLRELIPHACCPFERLERKHKLFATWLARKETGVMLGECPDLTRQEPLSYRQLWLIHHAFVRQALG